jgi:hypothetical protein
MLIVNAERLVVDVADQHYVLFRDPSKFTAYHSQLFWRGLRFSRRKACVLA